ncbi:hypothetical protein R1flu_001071 [Riccia fluitans]|uniref:Xylulose kinase n=1 Tax=Riccia fluitans TaxID=41844 RepID=A0ABD1Y2L0_9MARC
MCSAYLLQYGNRGGCEDEELENRLSSSSSTAMKCVSIIKGTRLGWGARMTAFTWDLTYETKDGVHRNRGWEGRITSPVLMWVEALQIALDRLQQKEFRFDKVVAVSGSGQQHGSVYWKTGSGEVLKNLDASKTLVSQLKGAFTTYDSPIWMDSTTSKQCREIEEASGGAQALCDLTGSRAHERFTGPQIRKLSQLQEHVYNDTERISLVSSFMASLLVGKYASIDYADGAGMNLMDLKRREWSDGILEATAPNLKKKLGPLAPSHGVAGKINSYFTSRYHFNPECAGVNWSGDNPCSLAGLAIEKPGDLGISLGTSDTVFGVSIDPKPGVDGHVFPNPVDPNSYMCMLCYKNGSLTRQEVRDRCAGKSWDSFNQYLDDTPPLNGEKIGFYFKEAEILPPLPAGIHRFDLSEAKGTSVGHGHVDTFDAATEVRAIVEGQFMAMRSHSRNFGMPNPERVIATGGASANHHLLRVCADVFGCNVYIASRPDSASLGAALRAAHGFRLQTDKSFSFSSLMKEASEDGATQLTLAIEAPKAEVHKSYDRLAEKKLKYESLLLQLADAQAIPVD